MIAVEHPILLVLAVPAAAAAWWLTARSRRPVWARSAATVTVALIGVALAGVGVGTPTAVRVFVVDVSASMGDVPATVLVQVRESAAALDPGHRVAVVAFVRDAVVLLPPTPVGTLPAQLPEPVEVDQGGSSVAAGLDVAASLLPPDAAGDIVLITDGRQTGGDAIAHAPRRPVQALTLLTQSGPDAWIRRVRAPGTVAAGQDVPFEIVAGANRPMRGTLVLLVNGRQLARPEPVQVGGADAAFARRARLLEPGLYTITARLLCDSDALSQNNESAAAIRVRGPLAVTFVAASGDRALADALAAQASVALRRVAPGALDLSTKELLRSDVLVLDDVSVDQLGRGRLASLVRFVRDAGRGLVVTGEANAFGPGGYAKTPLAGLLPVDPDPERRAAKPTAAVLVVDRSGSMKEIVGDRQKIEFVREALLRAGAEFAAQRGERSDELSIVAFNRQPEVLLERSRPGTPAGAAALRDAVRRIFPSGNTDIPPALVAARKLAAASKLKRNVIVVTDGRSQSPLDAGRIAAAMKANQIFLTVLGTSGAVNDGLAALKAAGDAPGGRFTLLRSVADLPHAMARATRAITDSLVRTGTFAVTRGPGRWAGELPAFADMTGYVLTGEREEAPAVLRVDRAPLLARWQRGLGRVAALTTTLDGGASNWSPEARAVVVDAVAWAGGGQTPEPARVELESDGRRLAIRVHTTKPLGDRALVARVTSPDRAVVEVPLRRAGLLRYEGSTDADKPGTYVATVADVKTADVLGEGHVTVGTSPEWMPGSDRSTATRLADLTGGTVLTSLSDLPPLEATRYGATERRDVSWILLLVAAGALVVSFAR
jgi:Mg-chelatase subunit ChlD